MDASKPPKELIVQACGKLELQPHCMMSKFPRGWPDLPVGALTTTREVDPSIPKRKRTPQMLREQPLLVQAGTAGPDGKTLGYRGTSDGAQSASAGLFMLIEEGNKFVAVPMDSWATFRPAVKHQAMSLEEAERFMWDRRGNTGGLEASHPRLASKTAMGDAGEGGPVSVHALVKREPPPPITDARPRDDAPEDDAPERDPVKREDGEEDWEHEQHAQDDDLDMGEEVPEEAQVPQQQDSGEGRRQSDAAQGGEVQGELSRIIKKHSTLLSADGDDDEEDEEDDDDDNEDAEDLDTMATRLQVKGSTGLRDPTPPPAAAKARGKTPPVASVGKRKDMERGAEGGEGAKRSKTSRTPSPAPAVVTLGARVEAAVRKLVGGRPARSVTMKDVTAMCKTTFAGSDWQEAIKPLLKRVLKLETDKDGNKWLALR